MAKDKTKPKAQFPIDPSEFLHHPHDRYVRFALQIRDLAMEFLQFSLDTRTKALIDWDSLQISKESYIDEKLNAHYSDICYTGLMLHISGFVKSNRSVLRSATNVIFGQIPYRFKAQQG